MGVQSCLAYAVDLPFQLQRYQKFFWTHSETHCPERVPDFGTDAHLLKIIVESIDFILSEPESVQTHLDSSTRLRLERHRLGGHVESPLAPEAGLPTAWVL